ncbi:hypothetical protein Bealeia1_01635 [Candidatus Bealeia paramacronuclearis]|uniref:Secreted protein n=1 Tax=Candidatus Bealeia paramacronuclearis TaxID=1921001 RepID=A0ABZ2C6Z2_9PROT|nr:hypothetical protein [Candidatus Bealeia paramacronuclearis]
MKKIFMISMLLSTSYYNIAKAQTNFCNVEGTCWNDLAFVMDNDNYWYDPCCYIIPQNLDSTNCSGYVSCCNNNSSKLSENNNCPPGWSNNALLNKNNKNLPIHKNPNNNNETTH